MPTPVEAEAALAAVRASRRQLIAAGADIPPLRHAAFAAIMGALVATPALPLAWRTGVFVVLMLGVTLVVRWDRERTGTFINGYRAGATRKVTLLMLAAVLGCYGLSCWSALGRGLVWPSLSLAIAAAAIAYACSVWWCRVFRREMDQAL